MTDVITLDFLQRSLGRHPEQRLDILPWIAIPEYSVARYQNFSSSANHIGNRIESHAAIYFDAIVQSTLAPDFGQLPHFVHGRRNKLLRPEPGIHRHHQ